MVEHRYGDSVLRVLIASGYGQRYDHEWGELAEIALLRKGRLRPGALVFDLGASYGVVAMMLAAAVGPEGRVIALEAHPADAEIARRNAALNQLDHLECLNAAVARSSGEVAFGHNGVVDDGSGRWGRIHVPAWSIDDLAARYGDPDVVFIDVEGFEYEAMLGAAATLERGADWFIEVHPEQMRRYGTATARDLIDMLVPESYSLQAARDVLGYVPGEGVRSRTRFVALDQFPDGALTERFFLIAQRSAQIG